MKEYYIYFYISSFWPQISTDSPDRRYTFMDNTWLDEQHYNDIKIRPFPYDRGEPITRGIFIYQISGRSNEDYQFFEHYYAKMIQFLNYLAYHCRHGFRDYRYHYQTKPIHDKELFDTKKLPSIRGWLLDQHGTYTPNFSNHVQQSLHDVDTIQVPATIQTKINTALSLYRDAFFQDTEEKRLTLQFIALEALSRTEEGTANFNEDLLADIKETVDSICAKRNAVSKDRQRIQSLIGSLSEESIRSMMRKTFKKYNINIKIHDKEIDIGKIYDIRCKFVHEGEKCELIHNDERISCHILCRKMEATIPTILKKIIEIYDQGKIKVVLNNSNHTTKTQT